MKATDADVAIIGGGIAGASLAAQVSPDTRVLLIERESQPGYHATGRSAATFSETYGTPATRALSRASREFLFNPPECFSDVPLVGKRGFLFVARIDQVERLERFSVLPQVADAVVRLSEKEARSLSPLLRPGYTCAALHEPTASDVDVHALMQGYLKQVRRAGGRMVTTAEVLGLEYKAGDWLIRTSAGEFRAQIVVNAAGAWADEIASMADATPLGITPFRRTAVLVDVPAGYRPSPWPLTIDIDEQFYFKPDAGKLLLSPADETISVACDALPDSLDVAMAVDRVEAATTLRISRVQRSWSGLRSFVQDRNPVVGYDPRIPGFFWLAALGGYGIQTSPAMGQLAAALLLKQELPVSIAETGLDLASVLPTRLVPRHHG